MLPVSTLAQSAQEALAMISGEADVREAEVFVAANGSLLTRLNYTSHIPCNGVEEPKSAESYGIAVRVVLAGAHAGRIGFGYEPGDITLAGAGRALEKAGRAGGG